ncbi:hypothetical protein Vretimale_14541 [Volvox reticuliferus]|uniref:Uncharacterized protein n=1 Tax=Volvox reticuliferus TaxID=1737510 RepID=A0A8J4GNV4_9CHLO|nr:hypothetical protein Vretifemale_13272 [Volvox reticuliferus]GIM10966.1 hypothetical protein Vretimale_14541 [Volvox reticuliferus]
MYDSPGELLGLTTQPERWRHTDARPRTTTSRPPSPPPPPPPPPSCLPPSYGLCVVLGSLEGVSGSVAGEGANASGLANASNALGTAYKVCGPEICASTAVLIVFAVHF